MEEEWIGILEPNEAKNSIDSIDWMWWYVSVPLTYVNSSICDERWTWQVSDWRMRQIHSQHVMCQSISLTPWWEEFFLTLVCKLPLATIVDSISLLVSFLFTVSPIEMYKKKNQIYIQLHTRGRKDGSIVELSSRSFSLSISFLRSRCISRRNVSIIESFWLTFDEDNSRLVQWYVRRFLYPLWAFLSTTSERERERKVLMWWFFSLFAEAPDTMTTMIDGTNWEDWSQFPFFAFFFLSLSPYDCLIYSNLIL